ncbi:MAG: flotillin family protein [Deltaproteobacteria bacterium]|nr:flotillin family protein [Deltaproteobacteria bacterium]
MVELNILALVVVFAVVLFVTITGLLRCYRRCPSDKILVVYGRTGGTSAKCIQGGGSFVWPVIQDFSFLDLKPLSIEANLQNALSRQNIRVDVPCRFTIAISTEPDTMNTAAERLLGMRGEQIQELAKDILFGQLRLVIATMTIEEINSDRDKFLDNISKNVDTELKKIGLKLINVNVTDIKDESGYIEALGKEAAAKAINEAKVSVAEQEKIGEIGKALADREKDTQIAETNRDRDVKIAITQKDEAIGRAEAERDTRVKTSAANAIAVSGENEARIAIAKSEALRREREAEASRTAVAAENIQQAGALEESYLAEQKAESARAERDRAAQLASIVVPSEIAKQKMIIEAEAKAENVRKQAEAEADAIYMKMEAEAKGLHEILTKQAAGYKEVVAAAGGDPTEAFRLLLIEKLPELVRTQVEAVKNIKIDKVTVWDGGNNANGNGSTANFVAGMMKSVPPLNDLFNMAGLDLPDYLKSNKPEKKELELPNQASLE